MDVKLSDFGLSRACHEVLRGGRDTFGTIHYLAPEMLEIDNPFDNRIDCWSLGIILHQILTGYPPFLAETDVKIAKKITEKEINFKEQIYNDLSLESLDLIDQLL